MMAFRIGFPYKVIVDLITNAGTQESRHCYLSNLCSSVKSTLITEPVVW